MELSEIRRRKLSYAAITSLGSKATTLAIHILAMPVAAIALGEVDFALYTILTAIVGWFSLANIGVGPSLTVNIAAANAEGKAYKEAELLSSAMLLTLITSVLFLLAGFLCLFSVDLAAVFGDAYVGSQDKIKDCLIVLALIFFLNTNSSIFQSAQLGYQELHVVNMFSMLAGLLTLPLLYLTYQYSPTLLDIIVVINIPLCVLKILNAAIFIRKRSYLLSYFSFRIACVARLLKQGIQFSLAGGLNHFLSHVLPIVIVGKYYSPNETAEFAVVMNTLALLSGFMAMLCMPLWPAIAESIAREDLKWVKRSYRNIIKINIFYGLIVFSIFYFFGANIYKVWYQGEVNPSKELIVWFGIYFVFLAWEVSHFSILAGLREITGAAMILSAKSLLATILILLFVSPGKPEIPFIVLSAVMIISSILLFLLTNKGLNKALQ